MIRCQYLLLLPLRYMKVDLRCGYSAVTEEILNVFNVDTGFYEQRGK